MISSEISSSSSSSRRLDLDSWGGLGEVAAGDLQAVEEEAGAARVDLVAGDALENLADGELDGSAVFREREVEDGFGGWGGGGFGEGFTGFAVVEAEFFVAEGATAAAVAVGEEVAALIGLRWCAGSV